VSAQPTEHQLVEQLFTPVSDGPDYRWVGPVQECLCGCSLFHMVAAFDEREVAFYMLDALCFQCGGKVTLPTPIDPPVHVVDEGEPEAPRWSGD
jgi:hypothetical protein